MFELDIDVMRPSQTRDKTVSVTDFGARADKDFCNSAAFQRAIDYCKSEGISELTVPRGIYYFRDGNHPTLDGLTDFRFDGGGSEFIFSTNHAYFSIRHCERVELRNFIVDWDWDVEPLASIGVVTEVNETGDVFHVAFPEYDTIPDNFPIRTLNPMNPLIMTQGCELGYELHELRIGKLQPLGGNAMRVELLTHEIYGKPRAQLGGAYVVRHYVYEGAAFSMKGNVHLTISDVTIYSTPGCGFVASGDQHHWKLERCRMVRRPGTTRCITATADGCHITNSKGYFVMEQCDFGFMGDDCLNIHDNSVQGIRRIDAKTLRVSRAQRWRNPFDPGDPIEFRAPDLSPIGFTGTVAASHYDEEQQECTVEFEGELPDELSERSILFNRRYDSGHYVLRRNYFHQNRARGILLLASNGLVEHNHFYMTQGSAIQIECGAESRWSEGYGVRNLVIRDNLFESCDVNHWNMAVIYMGVYLEQGRTNYPIFEDIRIENNTFVNCPQQAVYVSSCERVYIRNNALLNPNVGPLKTDQDGDPNCVVNREFYHGSMMASHCNDVTFENNRRLAIVPTMEGHIYIEPNTSRNVTLRNNNGFSDESR